MAKLNICELSDIFQGCAVERHPFKGRGVNDLVQLGYRFGCLVSYLPEAQNDRKFIADMRGIVLEMLDIADKNLGENTVVILPIVKDNPMTDFISNVVLKHLPAKRFEYLQQDYQIKYANIRKSNGNILNEGVRGVIPARPLVI